MNQLFDTSRWWLLVGRHWSENRKKYSLALIAIGGLMLLWFVLILSTDGHRGFNYGMQSITYYFGLFLVGCLYGSMLFADLGSKTRGLNYLVVPASQLEKLLCALFYSVVVFFLCYTAIFYVVDWAMIKISNAATYSYWLKHHSIGDVFEPQHIANVFLPAPENHHAEPIEQYLLLFYIVLQAAFILGSVFFTRFTLIKTVISLLLISLVMTFMVGKVITRILPPGNYYHGITSYEILTYKQIPDHGGIMIYSDPETDKLVSLPEWIGSVLLFLLKYAFAPLFWLAAFYPLKEKDIYEGIKNIIMQFRESQAIYLQIADYVCEQILLKEWKADARIPSVRELAIQLEVNPNTVLRTFDFLQQQEIIYNQRGIGYFVSAAAYKNALQYRKDAFSEKDLPGVFRNMYLLGMELDELKPRFDKYKKQHFSN